MKKIFLLLLVVCSGFASIGQIANVKASQTNGLATIIYDIQAPATANFYVKLLSSTDGGSSFSEELKFVNGDVRANVTGGIGKRISWDSKREVGDLNTNIVFKVVAEGRAKMHPALDNEYSKLSIVNIRREGNSVYLDLIVLPKKDYQFGFEPTYGVAFDNLGNKLTEHNAVIEGGSNRKDLIAGIPVKAIYSINGVIAEASSIVKLNIDCSFNRYIEFRNLNLPK